MPGQLEAYKTVRAETDGSKSWRAELIKYFGCLSVSMQDYAHIKQVIIVIFWCALLTPIENLKPYHIWKEKASGSAARTAFPIRLSLSHGAHAP